MKVVGEHANCILVVMFYRSLGTYTGPPHTGLRVEEVEEVALRLVKGW